MIDLTLIHIYTNAQLNSVEMWQQKCEEGLKFMKKGRT